jgi:3-hydroxyacyl-CoA dehydrogenase
VGSGLVGGSWSVVFARAGLDVKIHDPSPSSLESALDFARAALKALAHNDMLDGRDPDQLFRLIRPVSNLAEAVRDADYVQESAPERLALKQQLYKELAPLAPGTAVLASSTSGLPASAFTADIPGRHRCLVAHPINPPHLIPLVEIVPAPWTDPSAIARTATLMRQVGQSPIHLNREIAGFLVNRIQGAILAEAFRLVEDGIASAADIDTAMSEGLGLRWFFMGPFETIDLNAQGGVADYCAKLGPMYYDLAREQADPRPWGVDLVARIEQERRAKTPADGLDARKAWRDTVLAALVKAKRAILSANR